MTTCRECGGEIEERLEGDEICVACATRKVYAATRDPALCASDEEREAVRDLAHESWVGDGWRHGALFVAEVLRDQLRDAAEAALDAGAAEAAEIRRYCGGCGEPLSDATTAAFHSGSGYCRGCEDAPSDPPDEEEKADPRD